MPQTKLAQAVMNKIFDYLTANKSETVGPFTIKDSVVDENTDNPDGILDDFPLQTIVLKHTQDGLDELFYFHVTTGTEHVPVIHFHRYHGANANEDEEIYHGTISRIVGGTADNLILVFRTYMYLGGFRRSPIERRRELLADLAQKYPNPYYSGSLDNFNGDDLSNTVTQLMHLCFDKYIVRATLRNEIANTI